MSKSFTITLILCGLCLVGAGVMDAIDMRKKNADLEATKVALLHENRSLKAKTIEMEPYVSLDLVIDKAIK